MQPQPSPLPAPAAAPISAKRRRSSPWIRRSVQIGFFALVAFSLLDASLHAICPFGGVVTLYRLFTTGGFVQRIHASSVVLMLAVFGLAALSGPVFCGWACPLGSVQEWLAPLGKRLLGKRFNRLLPEKADRILRLLRFVVLALVVYDTAATARLVFQDVDPYYALFNFFSGEVALAAYAVLAATLLLSLAVERPWCSYACPYGALLGLSNPVRLLKLRRNEATCTRCGACDRACPSRIPVSKRATVNDVACIGCMECTSEAACPVKDTVVVEPVFTRRNLR